MDLDRYRSRPTTPPTWQVQGLRMSLRVLIIFALLFLAWHRGYASGDLLRLGLALLWAVSLPLMLAWTVRTLPRPPAVAPWQRTMMITLSVVILLGTFALAASRLVVPR